jgi:hypothetical protein
MRALQMFVLLGVGQGKRLHVTCIDASQELAARKTNGAATYLRSHGYEVEANPITSRSRPADILRHEIAGQKIGTLVMGACSHRGWREFLFGATTNELVAAPGCAFFVYRRCESSPLDRRIAPLRRTGRMCVQMTYINARSKPLPDRVFAEWWICYDNSLTCAFCSFDGDKRNRQRSRHVAPLANAGTLFRANL